MAGVEYFLFRILRLFRKLPVNLLSIGSTKKNFLEYFQGFDKVEAVRRIFGEKTTEVLGHLQIELSWVMGYMYVDGSDGHLVISKGYLNSGEKKHIYLDLIHELCHVKQFMDGRELFDPRYEYVDRPTEVEAYSYALKEARRIGFSEQEILSYLQTEWMSDDDLDRLIRNIEHLKDFSFG
jgi:hypothetical protein